MNSLVHVQSAFTAMQRADPLLTVADICGRIGAHEQTVYGWIRSGELEAIKFGSRVGYRVELASYKDVLRRRSTP